MEARRHPRYQLRAPIIFDWNSNYSMHQRGGGFTRDISIRGVFVLSTVSPPEGAAVALDLLLPPLSGATQGLRLQVDGQVIRVKESGEEKGFAATANFDLREAVNEGS